MSHKEDAKLVAAKQAYEVNYLTRKYRYLGVTKADVLEAVEKVGHSRHKVDAYIKEHFTKPAADETK